MTINRVPTYSDIKQQHAGPETGEKSTNSRSPGPLQPKPTITTSQQKTISKAYDILGNSCWQIDTHYNAYLCGLRDDYVPLPAAVKQVVDAAQFKEWMLYDKHWTYSDGKGVRCNRKLDTPRPTTKLLVHGGYDTNSELSPLSALCESLFHELRDHENLVLLPFYCGYQIDQYWNKGPTAIIRVFIAQLLRQNSSCADEFSKFAGWLNMIGGLVDRIRPGKQSQRISMRDVESGDIKALCNLFGYLVRQLPSTVTVVCIIDGVGLYEREEYEDDMVEILRFIVQLAEDEEQVVDATVKLFVTSPQPTLRLGDKLFGDGRSLLTMSTPLESEQGRRGRRFDTSLTVSNGHEHRKGNYRWKRGDPPSSASVMV